MAASRDGWREERAELPGQSGSLWLLPSLRIIPAGRLRLICVPQNYDCGINSLNCLALLLVSRVHSTEAARFVLSLNTAIKELS